MNIFYTPDINSNSYTLAEDESKHCIKVLRLKQNDTIYLVDGRGGFYTATIMNDHPKRCDVLVTDVKKDYGKRDFHIHIALAPTKNIDRFEMFLEKCTEIGIDEFTPIICQNSERRVVKTERAKKVVSAAMKQSLKAYHPKVNDQLDINKLLKTSFIGEKYIAYCNDENNVLLKDVYEKNKQALILIGPEGDFTQEEIDTAIAQGFIPISLGKERLRTETAGVVACHTINLINQ